MPRIKDDKTSSFFLRKSVVRLRAHKGFCFVEQRRWFSMTAEERVKKWIADDVYAEKLMVLATLVRCKFPKEDIAKTESMTLQELEELIEYDENCRYLQMFGMSANDGCYYNTSDNDIVGYAPEKNGAVYREKLKALPVRLYNQTGIPVDVLTRHNYVGGYNNCMNIDGSFDFDYLKKIGEDYIPED